MGVGWWAASTLTPSFRGRSWGQGADTDMILPALLSGSCHKGKHPSDAGHPPIPGLTQQARRQHYLHSALVCKTPRQFERGYYSSHSPPSVAA
jgi:hypothetical protein